MKDQIVKNWVTVPRSNADDALRWAKQCPFYITNDYAVKGGRTDHYQKGNDYDNFDFFFGATDLTQFEQLFGVNQ